MFLTSKITGPSTYTLIQNTGVFTSGAINTNFLDSVPFIYTPTFTAVQGAGGSLKITLAPKTASDASFGFSAAEKAEYDPFFTAFTATREEEAVGIVSGAWMGGMRGIVLMQTSGFATLPNVLASLPVPFQIPVLMMVSERGTLGEFNIGQAMVARTMRPALDSLGMEHTRRRKVAVPLLKPRRNG